MNDSTNNDPRSLEELIRADRAPRSAEATWTDLEQRLSQRSASTGLGETWLAADDEATSAHARRGWARLLVAAAAAVVLCVVAVVGAGQLRGEDETVVLADLASQADDLENGAGSTDAGVSDMGEQPAALPECDERPESRLEVDLDGDGFLELVDGSTIDLDQNERAVVWRTVDGCRWRGIGWVPARPAVRLICAVGPWSEQGVQTRQLVSVNAFRSPDATDETSPARFVTVHELVDGELVAHVQSRVPEGSPPLDSMQGTIVDWCDPEVVATPLHDSVAADWCGAGSYAATPPAGWHTLVVGEAACELFHPLPWTHPCQCDMRLPARIHVIPSAEAEQWLTDRVSELGVEVTSSTELLPDGSIAERVEARGAVSAMFNVPENFLYYVLPVTDTETAVVSGRWWPDLSTPDGSATIAYDDFVAAMEQLTASVAWIPTGAPPASAAPQGVPGPPPAVATPGAADVEAAEAATPPASATPTDADAGESPATDDDRLISESERAYRARFTNRAEPLLLLMFTVDAGEIPAFDAFEQWKVELAALDSAGQDLFVADEAAACWDSSLRTRLVAGGVSSDEVAELLAWPEGADSGSVAWYTQQVEPAALAALFDCVDYRVVGYGRALSATWGASTYGASELPTFTTSVACYGFDDLGADHWDGEGELFLSDLVARRFSPPDERPVDSRVEACSRAVSDVAGGPVREFCVAGSEPAALRPRPSDADAPLSVVAAQTCGLRASVLVDNEFELRSTDGWSAVVLPGSSTLIGWVPTERLRLASTG